MNRQTVQMVKWRGKFGKEYTDRNMMPPESMDALCKESYNLTMTEIYEEMIGNFDRSIRVLEVGTNTGNQLLCLQNMGFSALYGIEFQDYAVDLSKSRTKEINIIQGSAFDIPYKDNWFDLVFTSVYLYISIPQISF